MASQDNNGMTVKDWLIKTKTERFVKGTLLRSTEALLQAEEPVVFACAGMPEENALVGILVITQERVLYCQDSVFSHMLKELRIDDIVSVEASGGYVHIRGYRLTISFMTKGRYTYSQSIFEYLNARIASKSASAAPDSGQSEGAVLSPADELLKWKQVLDAGAITQEEYDAKKKQLLGL